MASPLQSFMEEVAETTGVRDPSELALAGNDNAHSGEGDVANSDSVADRNEESALEEASATSTASEQIIELIRNSDDDVDPALDRMLTDDELANVDWDALDDFHHSKSSSNTTTSSSSGSSSSLIDIRGLARLYNERQATAPIVHEGEDDWPLVDGTADRDGHLLMPGAAEGPQRNWGAWILAGAGFWLASIALTAAVTAYVVSRPGAAPADTADQVASLTESDSEASSAAVFSDTRPTLTEEAAVSEEADQVAEELEMNPEPIETVAPSPDAEPSVAVSAPARAEPIPSAVARVDARPQPEATVPEPAVTAAPTPSAEPAVATSEPATPASEPTTAPAAPAEDKCDEVLCLLEGKGCCGTAPKKAAASASDDSDTSVDTSLPASLGRAEMNSGLKPVQGRISACGSQHGVSGAVPVKFKISAAGAVQNASVKAGEPAFQQCLASVLTKAQFAETQKGFSMTFPIVIR